MITGEAQEAREKANKAAIVLGNGGRQIIVGDLARHATQRLKRVKMTTSEGSEALAVSELGIEHPTVRID